MLLFYFIGVPFTQWKSDELMIRIKVNQLIKMTKRFGGIAFATSFYLTTFKKLVKSKKGN